jgi:hypothetical protein
VGAVQTFEQIPDVGARYVLGPWQIYHLAMNPEVVESSLPVVAHAEDRNAVAADVVRLLFPVLQGDRQVDTLQVTDDLYAVLEAENGLLAPELESIWYFGARAVFDWRHYF